MLQRELDDFLGKTILLVLPFLLQRLQPLVYLCWQDSLGIKLVYSRGELGKNQVNSFWQHCGVYFLQLFPVRLKDNNYRTITLMFLLKI